MVDGSGSVRQYTVVLGEVKVHQGMRGRILHTEYKVQINNTTSRMVKRIVRVGYIYTYSRVDKSKSVELLVTAISYS